VRRHEFRIARYPITAPNVLLASRNRSGVREGCRIGRLSPVIPIGSVTAKNRLREMSMQFALLIYHTPEEFALREKDYSDPHLGAWRAYYKALVEAGVYVNANALEVPETATTGRAIRRDEGAIGRIHHSGSPFHQRRARMGCAMSGSIDRSGGSAATGP